MNGRSPALNAEVFRREADRAAAEETMSLRGTVVAAASLLTILVVAAAIGWDRIDAGQATPGVPVWFWVCLGAGVVLAIATILRPRWAPVSGPLYAIAEGAVVGAVSAIYELEFEGIVLQAVALTIGVFVVMLVLYATGLVKATENFRLGVISATGAIFLVYLFDIGLKVFGSGSGVPFIHDTGPIGIGISVVIVIVAALNLVLDFDFIENGVEGRAPAYMNWYAGFGLLVTLVWLYLEILRLLAKTRSR